MRVWRGRWRQCQLPPRRPCIQAATNYASACHVGHVPCPRPRRHTPHASALLAPAMVNATRSPQAVPINCSPLERYRLVTFAAGGAGAGRGKGEWIDFSEVPERRKQPKRIQTLPTGSSSTEDTGGVVFSYVEPEECRCECHHAASPTAACEQPPQWVEAVELNVVVSRPFTADLDLHSPLDVVSSPRNAPFSALTQGQQIFTSVSMFCRVGRQRQRLWQLRQRGVHGSDAPFARPPASVRPRPSLFEFNFYKYSLSTRLRDVIIFEM